MYAIIQRSFGGISGSYYIKNFALSLIFPFALMLILIQDKDFSDSVFAPLIIYSTVSCLLYPYSRFAYKRAIGYMAGHKPHSMGMLIDMAAKPFTMYLCWYFSAIAAPICLIYLYSKSRKK